MASIASRRRLILVVACGGLVAAGAAGALAAADHDEWPCAEFIFAQGHEPEGRATELEAAREGVEFLSLMRVPPDVVSEGRAAVDQSSGPDRFVEGKLYVDDTLVAEMPVVRADGGFAVVDFKACAPGGSGDVPTPSAVGPE